MEDYIRRGDVLDIVMQYCPDDDGSCSKADVDPREMLDEIEALPSADVQPVKHGRWKWDGCIVRCTVCGERPPDDWQTDFCQNCGARMDGDSE